MAAFLLSSPGVYRPQSDSAVLARTIERSGRARGRDVLDLGTGTGVAALAAARSGAGSVTAVDLSRRARPDRSIVRASTALSDCGR